MKKIQLFTFLLITQFLLKAQIPSGYYATATDSGYVLKTQLYNIIKNHSEKQYNNLWQYFDNTDLDTDGFIYDMYSENPNGTDPYNFTYNTNQCGNYSAEGDCYNREHSFPKSWFNDGSPMISDLHHIVPTDGYVNNIRGNDPYGETNSPTKTTQNGSKIGSGASGLGYSGTVFEPLDAFKGDFARIYFYMATRYENVITSWSSPVLDGSNDKVFSTWALSMLIKWHQNDPVSQKEIDRNNYIYYSVQNNRNPFVDHPEYVEKIWGSGTYCLKNINLTMCTGESTIIGGVPRSQEGTFSEILSGTSCDTISYTILSFTPVDTFFTRVDDYLVSYAANATFQWYDCATNTAISGETNDKYLTPSSTGTYALEVVQNGCTYKTDCYEFNKLSINEKNENKKSIYPNPTKNVLFISSNNKNNDIKVYNLLGKKIDIKLISENSIDVSNFEKGIYFLEIDNRILKFIKE